MTQNPENNTLASRLMPQKFGALGKAWVITLIIICAVGLYAYYTQLVNGLEVTGMRDYTSWGIYISNFVFFVAISLVGSLISAILKLTNVPWRTPLTRLSEIVAVSAIIFASISIVVDMGRPDRIFNLFLYGRIQSPIVWDVIVITTYLAISVLLLLIPLIPDMVICKKELGNVPNWLKKIYSLLSFNWKGTKEQFGIIHKSTKILAILIIPVALSIHTVTSWLFATTMRPGWDSTNFGAYFVSGAFVVGAAAVIAFMYAIRRQYNLKDVITEMHFDKMGKLLVMLSFVYLYFTVNEYFTPAFKMKKNEVHHLHSLFAGEYAPMFWITILGGMVIPSIIMLFKSGRKPRMMFVLAVIVIIGAWFKRYLIVIPTLLSTYFPIQRVPDLWKSYSPTWEEWSITIATLAGSLLLITIMVRYIPAIPIWEMQEEENKSLKSEES